MERMWQLAPEASGARRLGLAVRRLRLARGWSQRRLAAASTVSQSTVSRIENGLVPAAMIETVGRVLYALDDGEGIEFRMR